MQSNTQQYKVTQCNTYKDTTFNNFNTVSAKAHLYTKGEQHIGCHVLGCKYNFLAVFGIYVCIRFLYLYLVLQRGMTGSGCGVLGCEYNHLIHRARASTGPLCFLFTH